MPRIREYALYVLAACLLWLILLQHSAFAGATTGEETRAPSDAIDSATPPANRQPAPDRDATGPTSCGRCGVIESVRQTKRTAPRVAAVESGYGQYSMALLSLLIAAKFATPTAKAESPATVYEITVRFNDGPRRVLTESNPPKWKAGDRVMVVNGEIRPHR